MLSDSQRAAAAARASRADAARPTAAARAERRAGQGDEAVLPQRPPERTPLAPPLPGRECLEPGCGLARLLDPTTGELIDGLEHCGLHLR